MTFRLAMRWLVLSAMCGSSACERGEARDADPYAARLAVTPAPYDRGTAPKVAAVTTAADSLPPSYVAAQAASGERLYAATCARCHATTQWKGGTFAAGWQGRRLSDFYDLVSTTMPQDRPGALSQEEYLSVTAYVLQLAGFPSGVAPISADSAVLRHTRLNIPVADTTRGR
jgi:mono/diheme cytochrome c family protein